VWDVPWLESHWADELAQRTRAGPVIALIEFADRRLVTEARASGASVCLDLPVDLGDLTAALDRVTSPRREPAHTSPPPPLGRRGSPRAVADAGRDS
jgi:hypothetical protein